MLAIQTGATVHARVFILFIGLFLCAWTLLRLGKRSLLVSLGAVFTCIGLGLIVWAAIPGQFDRLAYWSGVQYPPLLYLVLALALLLALHVHVAARLSALDLRCRRLTQELALMKAEQQQR